MKHDPGQMLRRERAHASDFNAALYEHQQYLRRRVRPPISQSSLVTPLLSGNHCTCLSAEQ